MDYGMVLLFRERNGTSAYFLWSWISRKHDFLSYVNYLPKWTNLIQSDNLKIVLRGSKILSILICIYSRERRYTYHLTKCILFFFISTKLKLHNLALSPELPKESHNETLKTTTARVFAHIPAQTQQTKWIKPTGLNLMRICCRALVHVLQNNGRYFFVPVDHFAIYLRNLRSFAPRRLIKLVIASRYAAVTSWTTKLSKVGRYTFLSAL